MNPSDYYTAQNINSVRTQIARKLNYNIPYYATNEVIGNVVTDMDHFPYDRFFRGEYNNPHPVVMEREAGYRPRHDDCYKHISIPVPNKPSYCWQEPCSFVKPCHPDKKDSEKKVCIPTPP